jgi:hypothetical protein
MTSSTAGSVGNIFNRVATPDFTSVSNAIAPLDKNRDTVVTDVTKDYSKQTTVMKINEQLALFKSLFTQLFGDATKAQNDANTRISQVGSDIAAKKANLQKLNSIQPTIQKLVLTLGVAALVYAIFSPFGWIVHAGVIVILAVGIYLSLNNDISLPHVWS